MSCSSCGCAKQPCGCCEGVQVLTPQSEFNRPGLAALNYRVGTHASFMQTMQARLSTMEVDGMGSDGQPLSHLRPLLGLTTRDRSDPSIALLDAWATVGDVLSFYQERSANEAYLRTATERRSVLELSRLVGYALRPGVAATAYLAYTLDDNQKEPVTIPTGARTQSVPDPDETAQTFETSDDLPARREWNNLQVRLQQPQNITFANALSVPTVSVAGITTNLKPGDKLLMVFSDDGSVSVIRRVVSVDAQFADQRSVITLQPVPALAACVPLLSDSLNAIALLIDTTASSAEQRAWVDGMDRLNQSYLGVLSAPQIWVDDMRSAADEPLTPVVDTALTQLATDINAALAALGLPTGGVTTPAAFASKLLEPAIPQVRNSLQLTRNLAQAFLGPNAAMALARKAQPRGLLQAARAYADVGTQLLVSFVPQVARSYYTAWSGAQLNAAQAPLKSVQALRSRAALFGATAARLPGYTIGDGSDGMPTGTPPGLLLPPNLWKDWPYADDEDTNNAFLDQANEAIAPGSYVLADVAGERKVLRVVQATAAPRSAYGLSGPSMQLEFETPNNVGWRTVVDSVGSPETITAELRHTQLYVQSEALTLIGERLTEPVGEQQITLDGLYSELTSGRWVILSGERADIDHVDGVTTAELLMITGLSHGFDATLPGDTIHTTLVLATPPAYRYKRDTLKIYGNVVKATNGETRVEVLGSGDGAQELQSFTLKQPPLTFVSAATVAGVQTTLSVRVNDVEWHETDSLDALGAKDRGFITLTNDVGLTSLSFGNGEHGARLPTGVQNVKAVYRNGIGQPGNVKAGQIKLLQTKPLGVKEVVNPLRASGGADKETRDLARENAPLSVMALDRLVSVQDYADFTRRFAGIGKAIALSASDGQRQLVYLTIAGVDDIAIDITSDLYLNLLAALRDSGDADLPLRVDLRDLKALVLSANIKLLPDFEWEPVVIAVRTKLLDQFGFARRALGQPALLCEVIAAMQSVRGVDYVDVDAFGAIAQSVTDKVTDANGQVHFVRRLLTQDDIVDAIAAIVKPSVAKGSPIPDLLPPNIDAWPGGSDGRVLRPAELVMFMPGVADTLVLNQIP